MADDDDSDDSYELVDEIDPIRLCMVDRKCRLCRFKIRSGHAFQVDHDAVGQRVRVIFKRTQFVDIAAHAKLHMCGWLGCPSLRTHLVTGTHTSCLAMAPRCPLARITAATQYSYKPHRLEVRARARFFGAIWTAALCRQEWARRLPVELWWQIASYLPVSQPAAFYTGHQVAGKLARPSETIVDLALPVFVRTTVVEGVRYISSIENVPGTASLGRIDIGQDYLGIRCVLFPYARRPSLRDLGVGSGPRVWWSHISDCRRVRVVSDGLKVRRMFPEGQGSNHPTSTQWLSAPGLTLRNTVVLNPNPRHAPENRMLRLVCNAPGVLGYSARCGDGTLSIHSHTPDTALRDVYRESHSSADVWAYFPINRGEFVTRIFARVLGLLRRPHRVLNVAIIFDTNQNRQFVFAPFQPRSAVEYRLLRTLPRSPATKIHLTLCMNPWSSTIAAIGFEEDQEQASMQSLVEPTIDQPEVSWPEASERSFGFCGGWLTSSCRLAGVAEITPCYEKGHGRGRIIGILLLYNNGNFACIGEYRLDWAAEQPVPVRGKCLRIGFRENAVMSLAFETVEVEGVDRWECFPLDGVLEWWFSRNQSKLYHSAM